MNKHTPGPWTINKDSLGDLLEGFVNIDADSHRALATVVYQMEDDQGHNDDLAGSDVCRSNARLIAAAPDLLEALRDMVSAFAGLPCPSCSGDCSAANVPVSFCPLNAVKLADSAIAKATGESQ